MAHNISVYIFVVYFICLTAAFEDYRYHCPFGTAKKEETGDYVQCLPGDYSTHTCGDKHFCYFSGFNYLCCPEGKKPKPVPVNDFECPSDGFVQLDGNGDMSRCKKDSDCLGSSGLCHNNICCTASKKIEPTNYRVTPRKEETKKKIILVDLTKLDCPHPFLTVLNDEGHPSICEKSNPCSNKNEECIPVGKVSICCENLGSAGEEDDKSSEEDSNILKIFKSEETDSTEEDSNVETKIKDKIELTTEKEEEITTKTTQTTQATTVKVAETTVENKTTTKETKVGTPSLRPKVISNTLTVPTEEATKAIPTVTRKKEELNPLPAIRPRMHSSGPTKTVYEAVKLEPHTMGGYKKVGDDEAKSAKRVLVQEFLMNQIKKGWPYGDQFYWPEGYGDQLSGNDINK
uniref:CC domain-containing protein n=1 Tax=Parastrongyloides trichosuri TaxID=131310 RepID=A0A0N4ZWA3_PARTI